MRKGLASRIKPDESQVKKISIDTNHISKWQKEMEELQKRYDLNTKGGDDSGAQIIWNERTSNALKETE